MDSSVKAEARQFASTPHRTARPTEKEWTDPRIIAWWFIDDDAIRNRRAPEIVFVRGPETPRVFKPCCAEALDLESLVGYWQPIGAPEWDLARTDGATSDALASAGNKEQVDGWANDVAFVDREPPVAELIVAEAESTQRHSPFADRDVPIQPAAVENPQPLIDQGFTIEVDLNDLPFSQQLALHEKLLADGWRPSRWRHSTLGDHELVISDGFWRYRYPTGPAGVRWGVKNALAAIADGRSEIVRNSEGYLIAVTPHPNIPRFWEPASNPPRR